MTGSEALIAGLAFIGLLLGPIGIREWWRRYHGWHVAHAPADQSCDRCVIYKVDRKQRLHLRTIAHEQQVVTAPSRTHAPLGYVHETSSSSKPAGPRNLTRVDETDTGRQLIYNATMARWLPYVEGVDYTCVMRGNCGCIGAGRDALDADRTPIEACTVHAAEAGLWQLPTLHHREADYWSRRSEWPA